MIQSGSPFSGLRIGLGCMALTGIYGAVDPRSAAATIHRALELGITHFDTAELYGPYSNEELLAAALGPRIKQVQIATKFGYRLEGSQIAGVDCRPETIQRAVEGSLRRLRRETIDLLYQHRQDPTIPVEEVVGVMSDLVRSGHVRALGLSAVDSATVKRAQAVHEIHAVQNDYSLLRRGEESALLSALRSQAGSFVAYSPLARGLLTGNPMQSLTTRDQSDYRRSDPRFDAAGTAELQLRLSSLWRISKEHGVQPTVVALAWILQKDPRMFVIPGAKTPDQLEVCLQSASFRLTATEYSELDAMGT